MVVGLDMGSSATASLATIDPSKLPANVMTATVPGAATITTANGYVAMAGEPVPA